MIGQPLENPVVAVSVRVYQALLVAYPTKFQQEYGSHMLQVFRDCCLRTFHQGGTNAMFRLWAITLFDLVQSLVSEHTQKETFMSRSKFIRLSGWSLMLGALTLFLFFLGITVDEQVYDPFRRFQAFTEFSYLMFIWATPVLLGIGMFGLRTRYGDQVGSLGKNILLIGGISGFVLTMIGVATTETTEWGWVLLFAGNAFLLFCLGISGFLALRSKLLPRWNSLPIWAGLPFPLLMTISLTITSLTGGQTTKGLDLVLTIVVMLQCIALFMLGYILQSDVPEDVAATA
jgi:hypothetical protein